MAPNSSKLRWLTRRLLRQVWVRVTAFALLGVATAIAGFAFKDIIPSDLSVKIGADSVGSILQILASSMLAVTTFSLSILTAAYATAGGNATPRAVALLVEDSTSQTVLATFMGAFVFSLVGIILLETGVYGQAGRLILFAVTLLVVLIVVVSLLRWIARLGQLGRVEDNLDLVEAAAFEALRERLAEPWLGGNRMQGAPPPAAVPVASDRIGFLEHVDIDLLSRVAEENGLQIYLSASAGDFIHTGQPLLHVMGQAGSAEHIAGLTARMLAAHSIAQSRSFDQDPRHGLRVLSEIAQRALSPGINDPGTAELVIARMVHVLGQWTGPAQPELRYPSIWVPSLSAAEMLEIAFAPIARDAAANYQVQMALQSALLALSRMTPEVFAADTAEISALALQYSDAELPIPSHRAALGALSGQIADHARRAKDDSSALSLRQNDHPVRKL